MPQPRECQSEFITDLKTSIGTGKRRIIGCASTGFGKSVVLASIVKQALDKRSKTVNHARPYSVLIVLPRRSLVLQLSASFSKYGIRHGVIMAREHGNLNAEVQIASIDTLTARMDTGRLKFIDADMLLIDECHAQFTKKKVELFERYPLVIGVTATPVAPGNQSLGDFYQEIVEAIPMRELIEMGWLSPLRYFSPTDFHPENIKIGKDGDYSEKALMNYVDNRLQGDDGKKILVGDIYENWAKIAPDRKTVVFCGTQSHAKYVVDEFRSHGINAEYVDCNTDDEERTRIFTGMEHGDVQMIANVGIISMGVSIDNISCVILATATKLRSKYLQCVGRGTRIFEGKKDCIIIDHCGIVLSLGFAEDEQFWSLEGKESPEDRAKNKKEETKEPKEIKCVRCSAIFKSRRICPACGYEMIHKGEAMPVHQADLKEMDKTASITKIQPAEKVDFFSQLLHHSRSKGYSDGWAAHKFSDKFGHYPHKKTGVIPKPPTMEVLNFIKHLQIKNARGKAA